MTSSETPIEPMPEKPELIDPPAADAAEAAAPDDDRAGDGEGQRGDEAVSRSVPDARLVAGGRPRPRRSPVPALIALAIVAVGCLFILGSHRFHVTVPVVVLSLGWLAVVSSVYFLFRVGSAASDDDAEETLWWRPVGRRDELEREKRSLLKAIKEIEFDREMGKMTEGDAAEIVRVYRAHAIEVIKALDHLESGGPRSIRDEIERELRARMAVGSARGAKAKRKDKPAANDKPKTDAKADAQAVKSDGKKAAKESAS
jgi:hypothetical protein